jgi:hypothetical protein
MLLVLMYFQAKKVEEKLTSGMMQKAITACQ